MKILIIKHGALGDIINTTSAFSVIRQTYPQAKITLLTSSCYVNLAQKMGFFDELWEDNRSKNPLKIRKLCRKISQEKFDWVFDLQTSGRTSLYFWLLSFPKPLWSGIALGCSHPQTRKDRNLLATAIRLADQLKFAGLKVQSSELLPDMSWLKTDVKKFNLPKKYVLLVPGSSKKGMAKRWPAQKYIEFSEGLVTDHITPVLIGAEDEKEILSQIQHQVPVCLNLGGQTNFLEIAGLAQQALATVGNDTGAVHLAAAVGCPTFVLWSNFSSPDVFAPRGPKVQVIFQDDISALSVSTVQKEFQHFILRNCDVT